MINFLRIYPDPIRYCSSERDSAAVSAKPRPGWAQAGQAALYTLHISTIITAIDTIPAQGLRASQLTAAAAATTLLSLHLTEAQMLTRTGPGIRLCLSLNARSGAADPARISPPIAEPGWMADISRIV